MAETVVCNNKLKKLMTEDEGRGCCVIIYIITWTTMLARVWGSMIKYISREADWFKGRVVLKL